MPRTNLFFRNDTMFGVCQAIGEDFGVHPNYLRLILAGAFYFAPLGVIATYLALGVLVAASRWMLPDEIAPATPTLAATTSVIETAGEPAPESERLAA